jgi:hypothetical protein
VSTGISIKYIKKLLAGHDKFIKFLYLFET